ncbi:MAG: C39 family peptidase [Planctomycetes bacterium]|nr:C39 family peptidase [Planctomycetota bacterium]
MRSHWSWRAEGWSAGRREGARVEGGQLTGPGSWTVQVAVSDWDRGVLSLNHAPFQAGQSIEASVRVRSAGSFGPWLPWGRYGAGDDLPASTTTRLEACAVDVDLLELKAPADALELRLELRGDARLERVALALWRKGERPPEPPRPDAPEVYHALPQRSQKLAPEALRPRICSPTSLSMVLGYWGHGIDPADLAARVYDHGADLYGNWSFNVAAASSFGLQATVCRLSSMHELEGWLRAGVPVVLSHRYARGELSHPAVHETTGHLIAAAGIDPAGDVWVHDPAGLPGDATSPVRRVYKRAELAQTWLHNGDGVCYVVHPPGHAVPVGGAR